MAFPNPRETPPRTRTFGMGTGGRWVLVAAGTAAAAVGIGFSSVLLYEVPGLQSLLVALTWGFIFGGGGLATVRLGLTPRRHWVRVDDQGLSKPWAWGKPAIAWSDLSEVTWSVWTGLCARGSGSVRRLAIAVELEGFQELLDLLLDRLPLPPPKPPWALSRGAPGGAGSGVRASESSVECWAGAHRFEIAISELVGVRMDYVTNGELIPVIHVKDGIAWRVPVPRGVDPVVVYRALRGLCAAGRTLDPTGAPSPALDTPGFDAQRRAAMIQMVVRIAIAIAATTAAKSCLLERRR